MMRRLRQRYFKTKRSEDEFYSQMLYMSPKASHPIPRETDLIWMLPKHGPFIEDILMALMRITVSFHYKILTVLAD